MDKRMPADTAQKMIDAKKREARSQAMGGESLTKRQEDTLKKHSEHHSQDHMDLMRKLMRQGKSFTEAHNEAQKQVGK